MLGLSVITEKSNVLDLGCGNGNNSFFINKETKSKITGIDLSDTRIENAKSFGSKSNEVKNKIKFLQGSNQTSF